MDPLNYIINKDLSKLDPKDIGEMMDRLGIGVTISDPNIEDNPLIYANKGFADVTGYSADEIIGKNCRFLQGEKTNAQTVKLIKEKILGCELFTAEIINYRKDGQTFWNELTIAPIFDDDHQIKYFVGIQKDISEKKKAELQIKEDLLFAQNLQRGILSKDYSDNKISINSLYESCDELSGDGYYWRQINDNEYGVILYDVMGHGMSASLVSMMLRGLMSETGMILHPKDFPYVFNQYMNQYFEQIDETVYFTCIYLQVNTDNKKITYVNCGHPPGILINSNRHSCLLDKGTFPLGLLPEIPKVSNFGELDFKQGSRVILFSDGLLESEQQSLSSFSESIVDRANELNDLDNNDFMKELIDSFKSLDDLNDDISLVTVHLK